MSGTWVNGSRSGVFSAGDEAAGRTLLEVRNLNVEFLTGRGWVQVVQGVSFDVHPGRVLGIVGESGSGKSVTNLALMGLLKGDQARVVADRVSLAGRDLTTLKRRELEDLRGRDLAMIFQEPMTSLNPAFTVGNQIAETIRRHRGISRRDAWRQAVEMLDRVGIPDANRRAHGYPHEFSGGMRQRVMIAIATCCEPALLIADEPTTALDVTIQAQILDLLREMSRDLGMALVFITHDLGVVADICDDVLVMYAGQVVEQSGAVSLFGQPQHPYTDALLRAMPHFEVEGHDLEPIPGSAPAAGEAPDGCRFHERCAHAVSACSIEEPRLLDTDDGRSVRCLRSHELRLGVRS
jgi:oligopeptide/dipeptide ABC transporter ATP-binding protein